MREIIFRGKRLSDDVWTTGYLFPQSYRGKNKWFVAECVRNGSIQGFEVIPYTIGEYTGLLDKNGNKIFEGDVVECVSWNEYFSDPTTGKVMEPFRRKMEVVFMAGGFKLVEHLPQPCKDNVWNMIVEGDLTVIGNIHDNPELLN